MPIEVVHFNPSRRRPGWRKYLSVKKPLNNFGDLLGPMLVERIIREFGLTQPESTRRMLTIGSIMRMSQPGDVVWGSGINGKSMEFDLPADLDIRAVRGPLTRRFLQDRGYEVPAVYGDPALLWPLYWTRDFLRTEFPDVAERGVAVVPNHNDLRTVRDSRVISPLGDPLRIISQIISSDFVCGSSLHGIILAEAYGVPARLVSSGAEPQFKYDDYFAGTGRTNYRVAATVDEAIRMGGERAPRFDPEELLSAFPRDIFS